MTSRQPKGIPVGGQYAENAHDEAGASLDGFLFTGGDDTVIESGSGEWRSGGVIAFELNDGTEIEVDTGSNLPSYIDPQYEALADGNIRVRYATVDTDPGDYDEEDPISRFGDIESRNDFVRAKLDEGYSPEQIQFPFLFSNGGQSGSEYRGSSADEGWEDSTFGSRDYDVLVVGEAQDGWADRGVAAGNLREVIQSVEDGEGNMVVLPAYHAIAALPEGTKGKEEALAAIREFRFDDALTFVQSTGREDIDYEQNGRDYLQGRNDWENGDVYVLTEKRVDRGGYGVPGHMEGNIGGVHGDDAREMVENGW